MPSKSFEGLKKWIEKAVDYIKDNGDEYNQLSSEKKDRKLYKIYGDDHPFIEQSKLDSDKQKALLNKMVEVEGSSDTLKMFPQKMRTYGVRTIKDYKDNLQDSLKNQRKLLQDKLDTSESLSAKETKKIKSIIEGIDHYIQNPPNPLNHFAYFMERRDIKDKLQKDGESRLTLTFNPDKAGEVFDKLAQYMSNEDNADKWKYIKQLKVMGPGNQGTRTDSAVVYLSTSNPELAKKIAKDIKQKLNVDDSNWINHAPFGMTSMEKGISFSQTDPRRSSHGMARVAIIRSVINDYVKAADKSAFNIKKKLKEALKKSGYNETNPELMDLNNYKEMIKKKLLRVNAFELDQAIDSELQKMKKVFSKFNSDIMKREIISYYDSMYDADDEYEDSDEYVYDTDEEFDDDDEFDDSEVTDDDDGYDADDEADKPIKKNKVHKKRKKRQ